MRLRTYLLVLALLAGSCATAPVTVALASTGGAPAPPSSTTQDPVAATASGVAPTGIATWFGPGLYGKHTACGQTLTPQIVGVANRTLPCGTLVQVSYGGHTLTVPVLDRGPYSHHASWDLTAGAARALDVTETVRIATQVVGRTPNTPALGLPAGAQTGQSGASPAGGLSASGGSLAG